MFFVVSCITFVPSEDFLVKICMTRLGFFKWFWGAVYVRVLVYLYPVRTTIKKLKTQIGEWLLLHNII